MIRKDKQFVSRDILLEDYSCTYVLEFFVTKHPVLEQNSQLKYDAIIFVRKTRNYSKNGGHITNANVKRILKYSKRQKKSNLKVTKNFCF